MMRIPEESQMECGFSFICRNETMWSFELGLYGLEAIVPMLVTLDSMTEINDGTMLVKGTLREWPREKVEILPKATFMDWYRAHPFP